MGKGCWGVKYINTDFIIFVWQRGITFLTLNKMEAVKPFKINYFLRKIIIIFL